MGFVKSKKKVLIIVSIIVILAVGVSVAFANFNGAKPASASVETTTKVKKGNIKVEISGSGVLEPIESYDVTSLVSGKILSSTFEEGGMVKKDDLLYKFEATELEGNIQKTINSIAKLDLNSKDTRDNLNKTVIYAGADGRLINFNVKENDSVAGTKLGEIVDDGVCIAKVPFSEAQVSQINLGQSATVYSGTLMSSISGTVSKINNYPIKKANGAVLYTVEISIKGINSLAKESEVTAVIGSFESAEAGKIDIPETYSVTSSLVGRAKTVYVSNNDYVTKGQKLIELEGDTYTSSLNKSTLDRSDLEISLQTQHKQLENYNIKAPIDGKIILKNKKVNETVSAGGNTQPLMVVADISKMKFDMKIDELDINKLKLGQSVNVSADSLPDKTLVGQITSIADKGTATNGVSYYLVEVTVNEPGSLKTGMNVNAKTIVSDKQNILTVPASAVWKKDGKTFVSLPADENGKSKEVNVEIGISNKDLIEVVKGLNEGDTIVIPTNIKNKSGQ